MTTRRYFLKSTAILGAAIVAAMTVLAPQDAAAQALNPKQVPKFVNPLPNLLTPPDPLVPGSGFLWQPDPADPLNCPTPPCYTLQVQQFRQSLGLGAAVPLTTVWGYGTAAQAGTFPGRTFELQRGAPITVTYVNSLVRKHVKIT